MITLVFIVCALYCLIALTFAVAFKTIFYKDSLFLLFLLCLGWPIIVVVLIMGLRK